MAKKTLALCALLISCASVSAETVYSPYKDAGINMNWNTNQISTQVNGTTQTLSDALSSTGSSAISLAFATGQCGDESWGGIPGDSLATANLSLFEKNNVNYIISTGGAAGAFKCDSETDMKAFLNRYNYSSSHFKGLDFDIEGGYNQAEIEQLMNVTAKLQKEQNFRVSLTLATVAQPGSSLNQLGIWAVEAANAAGLDYNINLMVMDFGSSGCQTKADGSCDMAASAEFAAKEVSTMYGIPLSRIELTPMIGDNDTRDEITTVDDMKKIALFVKENKLAGLHYWSFDRDTPCVPATSWASPTCNNESTESQSFNKAALSVLG
jgi:chitinase